MDETQTEKKPYMLFNAGELTGKTDIEGLEYDFNYGARVKVPAGNWRVRLYDRDACVTLYDAKADNVIVTSTKKYFVNFRVEVFRDDELAWSHDCDAKGKKSPDQVSRRHPGRRAGLVPLLHGLPIPPRVRSILRDGARAG